MVFSNGLHSICSDAWGLDANAAGVTGCRIIDYPRERLIAILTNSFVPCNSRFPTLIAIITMFLVGTGGGLTNSLWGALVLTIFILFGVTRACTGYLNCGALSAPQSYPNTTSFLVVFWKITVYNVNINGNLTYEFIKFIETETDVNVDTKSLNEQGYTFISLNKEIGIEKS